MSHGPRIYNLFPLLAGRLPHWRAHLERAAAMGFTWVFVNAFHQAGYSGSLDSVKDHDAVDARLVEGSAPPAEQLADMLREASALGLSVMMDLVIKHTAFDWPMIQEHIDGSGGTSRARSFAPEPRMGSGGSCGGVRPRWTTPAAPTRGLCGPPDGDSPPRCAGDEIHLGPADLLIAYEVKPDGQATGIRAEPVGTAPWHRSARPSD